MPGLEPASKASRTAIRAFRRPSRALARTVAAIGIGLAGPARAGPDGSTAPLPIASLDDALRLDACEMAEARAGEAASAAERLALARCQVKLGKADEALATLDTVTGLDGYRAIVRGEALLALGRPAEAVMALEGAVEGGDAGARARMLRGEALVEAGRYALARRLLASMLTGRFAEAGSRARPDGADPAEVRWWLAEQARRRGEPDRAVPEWQLIWTLNPTSPRADQAAERLAEQGQPVPDVHSARGRSLLRTRIATLEKLHLYKEALALRDLMPADDSEAGHRALARACFRAKAYARAAKLFATLASPSPRDRYEYALSATRSGDYAAAARIYGELIQAAPKDALADLASFKLGYLAYDAGALDRAIDLFHAHLARYPHSRYGGEARWFIGWSLLRLGRLDEADAALVALADARPSASLTAAATYWRARIAGLKGDANRAQAGYERVLRRHPNSGYAWFAAWRLQKTWPGAAVTPGESSSGLNRAILQRAHDLARVGLDAWARDELDRLPRPTRRADRILLARARIEAGDYAGGHRLVASDCPRPGAPASTARMQACWPRPESAIVDRLARQAHLDPNLPYAIMWVESALSAGVTSPAGARGLMQLMPERAHTLHDRLFPGRPFDAEDLYHPAYNALLGVTGLGDLLARFEGGELKPALPLVIAAYNGGVDSVARWASNAALPGEQTPQIDVFTENIGYTETRAYVRRVLGYIQVYRQVYGG